MQNNELFHLDALVASKFPEIKVGVAVVRNVKVELENSKLEELKLNVLEEVRRQLAGKTLGELPRVQAYRKIYRRFGVDPGSRRPSAESLLRRVIDPAKGLYRINSVVDCYNLSSVEFQLPMAAYDFDQVVPPIMLRFAQAGELYCAIGQAQPEPLDAGELVYADQLNVLCRDFNYRDADITKVTSETKNLAIFVDGCSEVNSSEIAEALREVVERIVAFNGGVVETLAIHPIE